MKQKLSPQTSSFILLAGLCLVGGFLVIVISSQLLRSNFGAVIIPLGQQPQNSQTSNNDIIPQALASQDAALPDTSAWPLFQSPVYGIKFRVPPNWKVETAKPENGYSVIEMDPGKKYYNVKLYISKDDYFVMDGLPATKITLGGQPALNVSNLLYGIAYKGYYFTFDIGRSLSLSPQFNAMVKSVEFIR